VMVISWPIKKTPNRHFFSLTAIHPMSSGICVIERLSICNGIYREDRGPTAILRVVSCHGILDHGFSNGGCGGKHLF
jgi:hypothetical protein